MSDSNIILRYWPLRGRSGIINILLTYLGMPFVKKEYTNPIEWFANDKQSLGLDFPNLPYIIDGGVKVTETNAIVRYLPIRAGRRDLIGSNDDDRIQVEMTWYAVDDLRTNLFKLSWQSGDFQSNKETAFNEGTIKSKLEQLNKNLENKEWLIGSFSISDFNLFEGLCMINQMDDQILDVYPNLKQFHERFKNIGEIKEYLASEENSTLWLPANATWSK